MDAPETGLIVRRLKVTEAKPGCEGLSQVLSLGDQCRAVMVQARDTSWPAIADHRRPDPFTEGR